MDRYHATCQAWLKASGSVPDPFLAESVARCCVFGPGAVADREAPVRLAGSARAIDPEDRSGRARTTLGAALYRAGRFDEAIKQLGPNAPGDGREGTPIDWAFLALAHARRGDRPEARRWLEKRSSRTPPTDETVDPFWNELTIQLLHRECRALLENGPG
ncbi:MAG: type IV pilus biogenesis/stability protein PilW [Isosphaerales bacterium]